MVELLVLPRFKETQIIGMVAYVFKIINLDCKQTRLRAVRLRAEGC